MKVALPMALAAALAVSMAAPDAPARAQKPTAAPQPVIRMSDAFRKPATAAQTAITANDLVAAETSLATAEAAAENDDEKYFAAFLRFQLEGRKKNAAGITAALDKLLVNAKTPKNALPNYNFLRGKFATDARQYGAAIPYLTKARELGSKEKDIPFLLAGSYLQTNNMALAVTEMNLAIDAEKAAGRKAPESWYKAVVSKLDSFGDRSGTTSWLTRLLTEYPTGQNWRSYLALYRGNLEKDGQTLAAGEKLDLFRLQRATKALSDLNDFFDYAIATQKADLPWETKRIVEEGRTSGKIPANNGDTKFMLDTATTKLAAESSLATYETQAATATTGAASVKAADANLASGNFAKAATLYKQALTKGGVAADEINTRLGIALAESGDKAGAKAAFALVKAAPRSGIASLWTMWIDLTP